MGTKAEKNENSQNYINFTEKQIFEKIKEDLNPIQEKLKKINEWLQWTKLENKDKKEIWEAFEKLMKLEKNIDENTLKNEIIEIIKILNNLTKKDLAKLEQSIKWGKYEPNPENSVENAQKWRKESSDKFDLTVREATKDKNLVARKTGELMEYLMS